MSEYEKPFNSIITIVGDTFEVGKDPIIRTIDLGAMSTSELESLVGTYPEATYELYWRALTSSTDSSQASSE